jgi:hypothetical protein
VILLSIKRSYHADRTYTNHLYKGRTSWAEQEILGVPHGFHIVRARALITSGTGTTLALSVRESSVPTEDTDIVLQYGLT